MKRWGHMARVFTKLGKEITIAVKQGGAEVTGNPRLRALLAEARSEQMPKENIERAIKKATDKSVGDFKEVVFEGYGLTESHISSRRLPTRTSATSRRSFTKDTVLTASHTLSRQPPTTPPAPLPMCAATSQNAEEPSAQAAA